MPAPEAREIVRFAAADEAHRTPHHPHLPHYDAVIAHFLGRQLEFRIVMPFPENTGEIQVPIRSGYKILGRAEKRSAFRQPYEMAECATLFRPTRAAIQI
jgi:hypothetical protein